MSSSSSSFQVRAEAKEWKPLRVAAKPFVPGGSFTVTADPPPPAATTASTTTRWNEYGGFDDEAHVAAAGTAQPAAPFLAAQVDQSGSAVAAVSSRTVAPASNAAADGGAYIVDEHGGYFWLDLETASAHYGLATPEALDAYVAQQEAYMQAQQEAFFQQQYDAFDGAAAAAAAAAGDADAAATTAAASGADPAETEEQLQQRQQYAAQMWDEWYARQEQQMYAQYAAMQAQHAHAEQYSRLNDRTRKAMEIQRTRFEKKMDRIRQQKLEAKQRFFDEQRRHAQKRREAYMAIGSAIDRNGPLPTIKIGWDAHRAAMETNLIEHKKKKAAERRAAEAREREAAEAARLKEEAAARMTAEEAEARRKRQAERRKEARHRRALRRKQEREGGVAGDGAESGSGSDDGDENAHDGEKTPPPAAATADSTSAGFSPSSTFSNSLNASTTSGATPAPQGMKRTAKRRLQEAAMQQFTCAALQPLATELLTLSMNPIMAALRRETRAPLDRLRVESCPFALNALVVVSTASCSEGDAAAARSGVPREFASSDILRLKPQHLHQLRPSALLDFFHDVGTVVGRSSLMSGGGSGGGSGDTTNRWCLSVPFGDRVKAAAAPFVLLQNRAVPSIRPHIIRFCGESASMMLPFDASSAANAAAATQKPGKESAAAAAASAADATVRKDITKLVLAAVEPDSPLHTQSFVDMCRARSVDFGAILAFVHEVFAPLKNFHAVIEDVCMAPSSSPSPCRFVLQTTRADLRWATEGKDVVLLGGKERELWALLPDFVETDVPAPAAANAVNAPAAVAAPVVAEPPQSAPAVTVAPAPAVGKQPVVVTAATKTEAPPPAAVVVVEKPSPMPPTVASPAPAPAKNGTDSASGSNNTMLLAGAAIAVAAVGALAWKLLASKKSSSSGGTG